MKDKETKQKILQDLISSMDKLMADDIRKKKEPKVEVEVIDLTSDKPEMNEESPEIDEKSEMDEDDSDLNDISEDEKKRILKEYLKNKKD